MCADAVAGDQIVGHFSVWRLSSIILLGLVHLAYVTTE